MRAGFVAPGAAFALLIAAALAVPTAGQAQAPSPVATVAPATDSPALAASPAPEERAFSKCLQLVYTNTTHHSVPEQLTPASPSIDLDQRGRIARCVGERGFRPQAIAYLKDAIHTDVPDYHGDVTVKKVGAQEVVKTNTYARLAVLEFRAGRVADAKAHLHGDWFVDTPEMNAAGALIDPIDYRKAKVAAAKAARESDREFEAEFSVDQRAVLKREGDDYREQTFDAAGYHQVTWWYGGDSPRVAYTFLNGKLESVYRLR